MFVPLQEEEDRGGHGTRVRVPVMYSGIQGMEFPASFSIVHSTLAKKTDFYI